MKVTVLYDSFFGNTEKIAVSIGKSFEKPDHEVLLLRVSEASWEKVSDSDLIIIGSPTRGFRASPFTTGFLNEIPSEGLSNIKIAAFDTRMSLPDIDSQALRFIVKTGGYAAKRIAGLLEKKKGELVCEPEGFLVKGEEGPLLSGELERAGQWAKQILDSIE